MTRKLVALAGLIIFCLGVGGYAHRRRIAPVSRPLDFVFVLPTLIAGVGTVGIIIINKSYLPDALSPVSLLWNSVSLAVFLGALLLCYRVLNARLRDHARLGLLTLVLCVGGAFVVAFASPVERLEARPQLQHVTEKRTADSPPVILIVIDTLRADHVSAYGYERKTTPHFDAMVKEIGRAHV